MKRFTSENFINMPWKNGGGMTTQLYLYPDNPNYKLRLSMATVSQDGPFSFFPGMERHLLILAGAGCKLKTSDQTIELFKESNPLIFQGEENIFCTLLDGIISDFNVMVARDWGKAFVRITEDELFTCSSDIAFIFDQKKSILMQLDRGESIKINPKSILVEIKMAG